ncbi:MAG: hypothetical protein KDD46_08710, partial [Bdellovibrionales bacterium]|nr:hypothetical protein [Bdellovibrionales bacterium]
VLNKAFDDVDILLLKDKDIWPDGKPTTDEERGEWLEKHKNGRMLKRKEIENYLFDYEIILKAYPNTNEEDYKEIIKDIDSEDVKKKGSMLLELVDDKQLENSGVGYRNRDLMR